jgi:hypothetical protein
MSRLLRFFCNAFLSNRVNAWNRRVNQMGPWGIPVVDEKAASADVLKRGGRLRSKFP